MFRDFSSIWEIQDYTLQIKNRPDSFSSGRILFIELELRAAAKYIPSQFRRDGHEPDGASGATKQALMAAVGLDSGNEWDEFMEASDASVYIGAYTRFVQTDVHVDMDVLIRKADGTIRLIPPLLNPYIAQDVANSGNITSKDWQNFSGTYAFPGYTVVDQTDYLEIDLFAEATSNTSEESLTIDFRIDDPAFPIVSQTRVLEVLP